MEYQRRFVHIYVYINPGESSQERFDIHWNAITVSISKVMYGRWHIKIRFWNFTFWKTVFVGIHPRIYNLKNDALDTKCLVKYLLPSKQWRLRLWAQTSWRNDWVWEHNFLWYYFFISDNLCTCTYSNFNLVCDNHQKTSECEKCHTLIKV